MCAHELVDSIKRDLDADMTRLGHTLINGKYPFAIVSERESDENTPTDIRPLSQLMQLPTLTQYNEWGHRVDRLQTSEGWREMKKFAIREGYNSIAYERKYREHSRTVMFSRNLVMTGDSNVVSQL